MKPRNRQQPIHDRRYHVSHYYILNKHKLPVPCPDQRAWHFWMQTADRVLKRTGNDRTYVVTLFLGVDKAHAARKGSYIDPPKLFEVRIFRDRTSDEPELFATWKEAERAHERIADELLPTTYYT